MSELNYPIPQNTGEIYLVSEFVKEIRVVSSPMPNGMDKITKLEQSTIAVGFWIFTITTENSTAKIKFENQLYRGGFLEALKLLGFYKIFTNEGDVIFIRETNNIIEEVSPSEIKDIFYRECINSEKDLILSRNSDSNNVLIIKRTHLREVYLNQAHLIFNSSFLEHLESHQKNILHDNRKESYFPFRNAIFKVSGDKIDKIDYDELQETCVWKEYIIPHEIDNSAESVDCNFSRFIKNVSNNEPDRINAMRSGLGYLVHSFFEPSKVQTVIAYDETPAIYGNPEGGTGKGIFAQAIKQMRMITKIDGKKFKDDDKFKWQNITRQTQVVWLDDVRNDFDFTVLYSNTTDGWNIEGKYKGEDYIQPEDSPKTLITSNSILTRQGVSNRRRQFILEFGNHYSKQIKYGNEEPIRNEHGCIFFSGDWDENEWESFFSYMIQCVQFYLANGLCTYEFKNLERNQLLQSTSAEFTDWVQDKNFKFGNTYDTNDMYKDFIQTHYGGDDDIPQKRFSQWMKNYAELKGWGIHFRRSNGKSKLNFESL